MTDDAISTKIYIIPMVWYIMYGDDAVRLCHIPSQSACDILSHLIPLFGWIAQFTIPCIVSSLWRLRLWATFNWLTLSYFITKVYIQLCNKWEKAISHRQTKPVLWNLHCIFMTYISIETLYYQSTTIVLTYLSYLALMDYSESVIRSV